MNKIYFKLSPLEVFSIHQNSFGKNYYLAKHCPCEFITYYNFVQLLSIDHFQNNLILPVRAFEFITH